MSVVCNFDTDLTKCTNKVTFDIVDVRDRPELDWGTGWGRGPTRSRLPSRTRPIPASRYNEAKSLYNAKK